MMSTFKIMTPDSTGGFDSEQFFVSYIVATFGIIEGTGGEAARMENSFCIGLGQYGTDREVTCVGFKRERLGRTSMNENWCRRESLLQDREGLFLFVSPGEVCILSG